MNEIIPKAIAIIIMVLIPIAGYELIKWVYLKYKRYREKKRYSKFVDEYVSEYTAESFPPNSSMYIIKEEQSMKEWLNSRVFDNRTTLEKYCNHTNEIKEETQLPASEL